jgi:hypothetical protein
MENPSPLIKTINRAILFHNYSFFTIHNISQKGNTSRGEQGGLKGR